MTKRARREGRREALNERLGAIEVGDAAGKPPARTERLDMGRGEGSAASPSPAPDFIGLPKGSTIINPAPAVAGSVTITVGDKSVTRHVG